MGADEVVAGTVWMASTEADASVVGIATSGEVVGIITDAAEVVLIAVTPLDEVARLATELVLLLALHADFLEEVMVELEKCVKLDDGLATAVTWPAADENADEVALVTTALELPATLITLPDEVAAVAVAETAPVCEALIAPEYRVGPGTMYVERDW